MAGAEDRGSMSAIFPWADPLNPNGTPASIQSDLVIYEPFPGIIFWPTEPNGAVQVAREVNGCLWLITNADWNNSTLQFEQDTPTNPAEPAYALVMCETGTWTRYSAVATVTPGTPVVWQQLWQMAADGTVVHNPPVFTAESQVAESNNPTWSGGIAAIMVGRQELVTDVSSAAVSLIDNLEVNGTPVWCVRKDGTLTVGKVPASAVVGGIVQSITAGTGIAVSNVGNVWTIGVSHGDYVDLADTQTITGLKTIATAEGLLLGNANGSTGSIVGGGTQSDWTFGCVFVSAFTFRAEAVTAMVISNDPVNGFSIYYDAGLTIGNTYTPTLIFRVSTTGTVSTGTSVTPTQLAADMEGAGLIQVSYDSGVNKVKIDGIGLLATIVSSNNSILATLGPAQTYDLTVNTANAATFPQRGTGSVPIVLSGGGPPATITIPVPYASAAAYVAIVQLVASGTVYQATVTTYVDQLSGSTFDVYAEGDATTAQTVAFNWVTLKV